MLGKMLLLGLPLFLAIVPFLISGNHVFYSHKNPVILSTFTDTNLGGHSEVLETNQSNQKLSFRLRLNKGYSLPYAGMILQSEKTEMDISMFDTLKLRLNSNLDRIRVGLHFQIPKPGISVQSTNTIVMENWIDLKPGFKDYSLNLKDFKIPHWWYNFYGINQVVDHLVDYHRFSFIEITASDLTINGMEREIILEHIEFLQSPLPLLITFIVLLTIYYSLILLFYRHKCKLQKTPIPVNYLPSETMNDQDMIDTEKIVTIIKHHYKNPNFCLDRVISETALSPKRLNQLLKEKQGLSFIKYLNTLRLESARSLLLESKKSIAEIAYQCGFSNHTHFHRCFKEKEGISPGEFRKQKNH